MDILYLFLIYLAKNDIQSCLCFGLDIQSYPLPNGSRSVFEASLEYRSSRVPHFVHPFWLFCFGLLTPGLWSRQVNLHHVYLQYVIRLSWNEHTLFRIRFCPMARRTSLSWIKRSRRSASRRFPVPVAIVFSLATKKTNSPRGIVGYHSDTSHFLGSVWDKVDSGLQKRSPQVPQFVHLIRWNLMIIAGNAHFSSSTWKS